MPLQVMWKSDRCFPNASLWLSTSMFLIMCVSTLWLSGCCKRYDARAKADDEAARTWLNGVAGKDDWEAIKNWKSVPEPARLEASELLNQASWIHLDRAQVQGLLGGSGPTGVLGEPFLVRAVEDRRELLPAFPTINSSGDIWTAAGANSKCPVLIRKQPMVVWLSKAPGKVYVTFYVTKT